MLRPQKNYTFEDVNVTLRPRHWTQDTTVLSSDKVPSDQRLYLVMKTKINQRNAQINSGLIYY